MSLSSRHAAIRQLVEQLLAEDETGEPTIAEVPLELGGRTLGYRFSTESLAAVWLVDTDQVELYGADGEFLTVVACPPARGEAA